MGKDTAKRGNKSVIYISIGIFLVILAVVLLLWLLMRGETKTSGEWMGTKKSESITCKIIDKQYPFFAYDESNSNEIKVNAIFEDNKISSISLTNIVYYDNEKSIIDSENLNHIAMNNSFNDGGLKFDDLNLKFSKFDGGLQMNIYSDKLDGVSAKYFMLERQYIDDEMPAVQENYESKNFKCEINK